MKRALVAVAVLLATGCDSDSTWTLEDVEEPEQLLDDVEQRWRQDVAQRDSIIHDEARCYLHRAPDGGIATGSGHAVCGPVSHWVGTVAPATKQRPTAWVDGQRQFDSNYIPPSARAGHWDTYRFDDGHFDDGKVVFDAPVGFQYGMEHRHLEDLWRPDDLTPPKDVDLPRPDPPERAQIEAAPKVDLEVDRTYRPDPYEDGDLHLTYNLDITDGTWTESMTGMRELRLTVEPHIDVTDGYELALRMSDTATVTTPDGDSAGSVTEGARTSYEIGPHTEHPDLVFHLDEDTTEAEIELEPQVQYSRDSARDDIEPTSGVAQLPYERFTIQLVDE